ncbi:hypothetical protein ACIP79_08210 [Streptomyces sp. NPDC088747]|uniref:hypothetical protein n=1 Tax=Streptomyces sp. NPDC088747 TaxID=3365886 RepID=UPI0037FADB44
MRLQSAQLEWNDRVTTEAQKRGFTAFTPQRENQRGHDPSLILVRGPRMLLLWLRTGRRKPLPAVDAYREAGLDAHGFWPADWPQIVSLLLRAPDPVITALASRQGVQDRPDGDDAA